MNCFNCKMPLYLLRFSASFVLTFKSSGKAVLVSRQVFSLLSCSTISGQFASNVRSVITSMSHRIVVSLTGPFEVCVHSTCQ